MALFGMATGKRCHNTFKSEIGLDILCGRPMLEHNHHTAAGKLYPGAAPDGPCWYCPYCDHPCTACAVIDDEELF